MLALFCYSKDVRPKFNPAPATKSFDSIANGRPLGGFLRLFG